MAEMSETPLESEAVKLWPDDPINSIAMPTNRRDFLLTGATLPLITACASDITRLDSRPVADLAKDLGVCAASYTVLRKGMPSSPMALTGCDAEPRPDAVFQAASLTKPVVAFAALQLALVGRLDLDAPVSTYLPQGYRHFHRMLARSDNDAHDVVPVGTLGQISVRHLLNHTSGLPNWSSEPMSFASKPGERWGYSGEGFMLLQSVLEAISGTEISVWLDDRVFRPLGMGDSSLVWRDAYEGRAVDGTLPFGLRQRVRFRSAVAAASLYTTAADYACFMAAVLSDGHLLSTISSKPVLVDASLGLQWGLGWGIEQARGGPYLWQWGNNPGFRAFAMASTSSKDGFVMLTNHGRGMPLAASLARSVVPSEHQVFRFPRVS